MKRSRNAGSEPGPEARPTLGRRGFLRKAGLGGVGALAVAGLTDLLASPAANASTTRGARAGATGRMVILKSGAKPDTECRGVATCSPCSGCCGAPCKPTGVGYCFYCTATPCQGAGVQCLDHPPKQFTICCT